MQYIILTGYKQKLHHPMKKTFDKIQYPFMIKKKTLRKLRIERTSSS